MGLTCDDDELKGRVDDPGRHSHKINDLELMEEDLGSGILDPPHFARPVRHDQYHGRSARTHGAKYPSYA
ncbi:MAG: hypothetical protein ACI8Z1_003368, partial [Candidatus Azotimanducaceae bacterium]